MAILKKKEKQELVKIEKTKRRKDADKIIRNHILWAMGAGTFPIPVVDVIGVTAIQVDMLRQLCVLYEIDFHENQGKTLVSAIAGGSFARGTASLIKAIPGIGSFFGGAAMSVMSGATTYALGQVFIGNFEDGVQLIDFNIGKGEEIFEEAYEKGKEYVETIRKKD